MVWSGVILLLLAAISVIATFVAILGSYKEAIDASSLSTQPNNSPKAIIIGYIPLLCAPALTLVGLVLLILGFIRRRPVQ